MEISARNAFKGQVSGLSCGTVNTEVTLLTNGGHTLVAVVTSHSAKAMGLVVGQDLVAWVKASWVLLAQEGMQPGRRVSARNQFKGQITSLVDGAISTQVVLTLPGGDLVCAVVTKDAARDLALAVGQPIVAIIKASDVVLAVPA